MSLRDTPDGRPRRRIGLLKRSGSSIVALERRIAFDGAAAATAARAVHRATPLADDHAPSAPRFEDVAPRFEAGLRGNDAIREVVPAASPNSKSVVFVESDVPDLRTLIGGLDRSVTVVVLDASKDGVEGIADYLGQHPGVQNVYIFSHGSDAHLELGTADLDSASMLGRYADDLASIKASLGQNANILVYGCDFAEFADGDSAAHLLSTLTGASVAASTNLTGSAKLGGDFVLEDRIGSISAPDIVSDRLAEDYSGLLAIQNTGAFTISTGTSGSATSSQTVATALTADGNVKIVVTVTPNAGNSSGSLTTTTTGATFDNTAPTSAYTTAVNGAAALEETLVFGGSSGGTDGTNSAIVTIAYFDAHTGKALTVTDPTFNIDRLGGSSSSGGASLSNSSDLAIQTSGATLTRLSGSSSAFNVTSTDIFETINTALGSGYTADANADPTKGTSAGTVQINGSGSSFSFLWSKASGALNGNGDRIDLIFNADTAIYAGTMATQNVTDSQKNVSIDTTSGFSNPSGLPTTYAISSGSTLPTGLSFDSTTGLITGTVDRDASQNGPSHNGQYDVTITATNSTGSSATQTFAIDAANTPPVVGTSTGHQTNHDGDTITTVDASTAFSDPNGDPMTYSASNLPSGLSIDAAGHITGKVAANARPGDYTVTVTATDDKGAATPETFTWTILDVPPTASGTLSNQIYADGHSGVSIDTSKGFSNPNGLPLTYSVTGLPTGLSINASTGLVTGTIDHDASKNAPTRTGSGATLDGKYSVVVTVDDGQGGTASQTFTIDATNTAPTLVSTTANQTNFDGATITPVNASAAFSDANGDPLTFTATGLPSGLSINASTGQITGKVAGNAAPGAYPVSITATDDKGAATTESFTWTIQDVPPARNGTLPSKTYADGQSGISIDASGGFTSPNNLTLTYGATGLPAGLSINTATGLVTGTLDHDASKNAPSRTGSGATLDGKYTVTITASDGQGGSTTQTFTIDATNTAPLVGIATAHQSNLDGDTIATVDASGGFSDPNGDPLTYSASNLPSGLSIDPSTGHITGTVAANAAPGTYTVGVTATDDKGAATTEHFTWTIRDVPPTANGTLPNKIYADGQGGIAIDTAGGFTSPNGLALTYSVTGLPAGLSIDPATGRITGSVDHDASKTAPNQSGSGATLDGQYAVTVTASDGQGGSATQRFTIDATNTAPLLGTRTADQANDDGATIVPVDASSAFSDPNGDPLTFGATGLPLGLSIDPSTGRITGTVAANAAPGRYSVGVTATDDKGASTTESFTWTIRDVPPVANGALAAQTYADGTGNIALDTAGGFTSPNGLALTYAATGLPAGLSIDATTGRITGTLDHDASKNAPTTTGSGATLDGRYAVTVTASDGQGGTATQRFTIDATNTAPVVGTPTPDKVNYAGDTVTSVDASTAFADPNGDPLTFSATSLPSGLTIDPSSGRISGMVTTHAAAGAYGVTITATDDKGAVATETLTWTIEATTPAAYGTLANASLADGQSGVAIDTSAGFAARQGSTLVYSAAGLPAGLSIDPSTGLITGTVDHDASKSAPVQTGAGATLDGQYAVTVTVVDQQGGTASQTFTIDAANAAPVLGTRTPDQANHDGEAIAPVDASAAFSDPNGDPLTFSVTGLPTGLSIDPTTGRLSGRVAPNATPGDYTVTVTATDDKGAAVTESFVWTIQDVPPTAAGAIAPRSYADGAPNVAIDTAGGFSSPNGLPLTYAATGLPAGLSIDASTGRITGTLDRDASGNAPVQTGSGGTLDGRYTVTITASDGLGGSAIQTFTIDSANTAPVLGTRTPDQANHDGEAITPVDVSAAFSDPNGDPLTFGVTGLPTGLSIDPTTGRLSGRVAPNATPGDYTVTVTATDDKGAAVTESFVWTIQDVPPTANGVIPPRTYADGQSGVTIDTAGGFSSPNGLPLTYAATGLPAGLTIDPSTGRVTGTLDRDASGNAPVQTGSGATLDGRYTVTITASDGLGGSAIQTFTIDSANTAPVLGTRTPDQANHDGEAITPVDVSAAFSDPNGDPLAFSVTGLPTGLSIDPTTGRLSGRVAPNATPGDYTVTVTATDDKGAAVTESFVWTIQDVPPTAAGAISPRSYADGTPNVAIDTADGFSSPNGLPLTYAASGLPAGLTIDPSSGRIIGTLDRDASGNAPVQTGSGATLAGRYTVTITASDGLGGSAIRTFTIDATNTAPVLGTRTPDQANHDGEVITPVNASSAFSDPNGDPLTFSATGLPAGLSIDPTTGRITGTIIANAAPGPYPVTVTGTDDKGATASESFVWTIRDVPPTAAGTIPPRTYADGQSGIAIDTAGGFTNPNGLPLTYAATGLPAGLSIDPSTGRITGTLDRNASGNALVQTGSGGTLDGKYTVVVTVSDGQGGSAAQTFTIDALNTAPALGTRTPDQTNHDGETIATVNGATAFIDPNGDPLTFSATGLPLGLSIDPTTGRITGKVAADAAPGPYQVVVTGTDDKGATATERFTWTIDGPTRSNAGPPLLEVQAIQAAQVPSALSTEYRGSDEDDRHPMSFAASDVLLDAVNGLVRLDALPALTDHNIVSTAVAGVDDDLTVPCDGPFADDRIALSPLEFLGSSVRADPTPGAAGAVGLDTLVRDRVIVISANIRNPDLKNAPIVGWEITDLDGRPLPAWLHNHGHGMLSGIVPSNVQIVDILVKAKTKNGTIQERAFSVGTKAGHIKTMPLPAAGSQRLGAGAVLSPRGGGVTAPRP